MPTMSDMRQAVLDAYPNASLIFRQKIATGKNTRQVVAIYKKLKKEPAKEESDYHQIDIFEWLLSKENVVKKTEEE